MSKVSCANCDFCGKSEHEVEVIVLGPRADICNRCAAWVIGRLPEITDEEIDSVAGDMPGGMDGFLKGWGWRQFARNVLALRSGNSKGREKGE